jgi:hypothetical protein
MLNPGLQINIWCVLPIQAKWLAVIEIVVVFFLYAQRSINPLMGFFALGGCAAAYFWARVTSWGGLRLYAATRLPARPAKAQVPADDAFTWRSLNPFDRIARARRKKQFERLMRDD